MSRRKVKPPADFVSRDIPRIFEAGTTILHAVGWKACASAGGTSRKQLPRLRLGTSTSVEYELELGDVHCWLVFGLPAVPMRGVARPRWCVALPCGYVPLSHFMNMRGWDAPPPPKDVCRCGKSYADMTRFTLQTFKSSPRVARIGLTKTPRFFKKARVSAVLCPECYEALEDALLERGLVQV